MDKTCKKNSKLVTGRPNFMDQRNPRTFPEHSNQNSTVFPGHSRTAIIFQVFKVFQDVLGTLSMPIWEN